MKAARYIYRYFHLWHYPLLGRSRGFPDISGSEPDAARYVTTSQTPPDVSLFPLSMDMPRRDI